MARLILDRPGPATLVVDYGRPQARSLGVPLGGAADRAALALANALAGNPPDAAGLEFALAGPTLHADADLACVVFGAAFDIFSDRQKLEMGKTFTLHTGEKLTIGGARDGMRGYFCLRGGLEAPLVLGSRSSLEPLAAGAVLGCMPGRTHGRSVVPDDLFPSWTGGSRTLRVLDGPQAGWFSVDEFLTPACFEVTPASNRMGLRLRGTALRVSDREMVSEPVCPGAVQVTRDGQCIVLGVDGQTIGGYPKIAQVAAADLDLLGQLRPGETVVFVRIGLEEARQLYLQRQRLLADWVGRLRVTEGLLGTGSAS
jgi:antagonist of KipI